MLQRHLLPTYQASDLYIYLKVHINRLEGNKMDNNASIARPGCAARLGHDPAACGAEKWTREENSAIIVGAGSKQPVPQCEPSPHAFLKRLC